MRARQEALTNFFQVGRQPSLRRQRSKAIWSSLEAFEGRVLLSATGMLADDVLVLDENRSSAISEGAGVAEASTAALVTDLNQATTQMETDQTSANIAINENGVVLVAWVHETPWPHDEGQYEVRFRRFTSDGTPLDATDRIASLNTGSSRQRPAVAIAADGSFIIGYEGTDSDGYSRVWFDHYDSDGNFIRRIQLFKTETQNQSEIDLAMTRSGTIVAIWRESFPSYPPGVYFRIYAQVFDSTGTATTEPFLTDEAFNPEQLSVDVNDAGDFIIGATSFGTQGVMSSVSFRRFDVNGNRLGETQSYSGQFQGVDIPYHYARAGIANDGSYVIAYLADRTPVWRLFNSDGTQRAEGGLDAFYVFSLDMNGDGTFAIGYIKRNATDGNFDDAVVAFFDKTGWPGQSFTVHQDLLQSQADTQVSIQNNLLAASYGERISLSDDDIEFSVFQVEPSEAKRDNIGVAHPNGTGGLVFSVDSNGNHVFDPDDVVFNFGLAGDTVITGDWNGDGVDEIGVARPNGTGGLTFYLDFNGNYEFDAGDAVFNFGLAGDVIVVGDWRGIGNDTVGVGRANEGGGLTFYLDASGSHYFELPDDLVVYFGLAGDRVVVGDWNGDGVDDLGVARANGTGGLTFFLDSDGSGHFAPNDAIFNFGLEGDRVVAGDWNGDDVDGLGVVRSNSTGGATMLLDVNGDQKFDYFDSLFAFDYGLADDLILAGDWRQTALA